MRRFFAIGVLFLATACRESAVAEPTVVGWVNSGPEEARIEAIRVSPRSASVVIAAGEHAIFRSADGGDSWTRVLLGGPTFGARTVRFDPRNDEVWVAHGRGVLRSADGGVTWSPAPPIEKSVVDLYIDPQNGTVFAATAEGLVTLDARDQTWRAIPLLDGIEGGSVWSIAGDGGGTLWTGTMDHGLLESRDGGASWRRVGGAGGEVASIAWVAPSTLHVIAQGRYRRSSDGGRSWTSSPDVQDTKLYALELAGSNTLYAKGDTSHYQSVDGGRSWNPLIFEEAWLKLPVADPKRPSTLYAAAFDDAIYKSDDAGTSWKRITRGLRGATVGFQAAEATDPIAFDPRNRGTLYALGTHLYKSIDHGRTWTAIRRANAPFESFSAVLVGADSSVRLFPTFSNVRLHSRDGGRTWSEEETVRQFPRLVGDPRSGAIFDLTEGISRSTDGGATWTLLSHDGPSHHLTFAPDGTMFGVRESRLLKSVDQGKTWLRLALEVAVFDLALDPRDARTIWAAGFGEVHRNEREGEGAWTERSHGLPPLRIRSIAVRPDDPETLVVAVEGEGLWMTTNAGEHWTRLEPDGGPSFPAAVQFDPHEPARLYVAAEGESVYTIVLPAREGA